MVVIANIRERLALSAINDDELQISLNRAIRDYKDVEFDDENDEIEVIACKTIYYVVPSLFLKIQQNALEFDETMQTFKDMEEFRNVWLDRAESLLSSPILDDEDIICIAI